jgi:hypothetical protein
MHVILTQFMNFVMVAKIAVVAIFPNVAGVGVEERVVASGCTRIGFRRSLPVPGRLGVERMVSRRTPPEAER